MESLALKLLELLIPLVAPEIANLITALIKDLISELGKLADNKNQNQNQNQNNPDLNLFGDHVKIIIESINRSSILDNNEKRLAAFNAIKNFAADINLKISDSSIDALIPMAVKMVRQEKQEKQER
jgi:hypothetical protein